MKWIDLFQFLNKKANDIKNLGKFDWQAPVVIHDAETGDEFTCDTFNISDKKEQDRFVLVVNMSAIYKDN
jgi:hypothetical protein